MLAKIKTILLWIIVIGYFPVLYAFVSISKSEQVCSGVNVAVMDSLDAGFVNSFQLNEVLLKKYPRMLGGKVQDINCEDVESFLKKHEAIRSCEAYRTIGGQLKVFIKQRSPLLRVFSGYDSYYIDKFGEKMPLFDKYTARVLVLSGHVNTLDSLTRVIEFAHFLRKDKFWDAQLEQIYVEKNGDFTLAPRVGDQKIYLGSLDNYPIKMRNLYALYTKGLHPREWNNYTSIDLKFEGQIICTKR